MLPPCFVDSSLSRPQSVQKKKNNFLYCGTVTGAPVISLLVKPIRLLLAQRPSSVLYSLPFFSYPGSLLNDIKTYSSYHRFSLIALSLADGKAFCQGLL